MPMVLADALVTQQERIVWHLRAVEICTHLFLTVSKEAVTRNLEFSVTIEELWKLFEDQGAKCSISGLPISFGKYSRTDIGKPCTASLDRISSEDGYLRGNIQWVHKDVNIMKNKLTQEYFIDLCKIIAERNCHGSKCG